MGDSSPGEGWWRASDGRWYPPEQHPDVVAATEIAPIRPTPSSVAASHVSGSRSLNIAAIWTAGGRGRLVLVGVVAVVVLFVGGLVSTMTEKEGGTGTGQEWCEEVMQDLVTDIEDYGGAPNVTPRGDISEACADPGLGPFTEEEPPF